MSSTQSTIDFILEQISAAGVVSARKMFGEYAIYCNSKLVALVCDDILYVKPTQVGKNFLQTFEEGFPYPGSKAYLMIAIDACENDEWISELIRLTEAELPKPKPKKLK